MSFEKLAERGFRVAPFRHPRKALVRTADRPEQGQRLVERLAAAGDRYGRSAESISTSFPAVRPDIACVTWKPSPLSRRPTVAAPPLKSAAANGSRPGRKPCAAPTIAFES